MAARSLQPDPACCMARRTVGTMARRCSRDASSGTTPPYLPCVASCEATTEESTRSPSSTTAAAVSSQEDSIPRMRIAHRGDAGIGQSFQLEDLHPDRLALHHHRAEWVDLRHVAQLVQRRLADDDMGLEDLVLAFQARRQVDAVTDGREVRSEERRVGKE